MTDIAKKLRDMRALAGDRCDPDFNRALLDAADEIDRLMACVSGLQQALAQAADAVELQEAEQRGFERGRAYGQSPK